MGGKNGGSLSGGIREGECLERPGRAGQNIAGLPQFERSDVVGPIALAEANDRLRSEPFERLTESRKSKPSDFGLVSGAIACSEPEEAFVHGRPG